MDLGKPWGAEKEEGTQKGGTGEGRWGWMRVSLGLETTIRTGDESRVGIWPRSTLMDKMKSKKNLQRIGHSNSIIVLLIMILQ